MSIATTIRRGLWAVLIGAAALGGQAAWAAKAKPAPILKVLFLGDSGHHAPHERLRQMAPSMISRGIQLVYTEDVGSLTLENLRLYDALLVYADIDTIEPQADEALHDYVTGGGGLVALHAGSYSFRNSKYYASMVGGQYKAHDGLKPFRTRIAAPNHPVMQGFNGFESTDEPYVHDRHNTQGRAVLEYRDDEPYTWVRDEGQGHVFYTAWGHDTQTWSKQEFDDLVERGIRFAAGQSVPEALANRPNIPKLELVNATDKIPYFSPSKWFKPDSTSWAMMQRPLAVNDSMAHLVVPGGFKVEHVASDPDIKKPIAMSWDERGRLWIAETVDYPNRLLPNSRGNDRLVICEDKNNDGRMDKFTVFADGLNIPTGFTFARGGVIVHNAPETLFLRDNNGDDRADEREILLNGWGRFDTHAGPSNLQYGLDNWIYGTVGYSGFNGTVGGRQLNFGMSIVRFRSDGSALEVLGPTMDNTWGLGQSEEGGVFASTANSNPSVYLPIPNRYYQAAGQEPRRLEGIFNRSRFLAISERVRQGDGHWGYTASAGHALYTARTYPKEYWNRIAFVNEPTGHLVGQFSIAAKGASYGTINHSNLISSDDEWFSPIMAEVGPDGSMWVIDWYNYIIMHNGPPKDSEFKYGEGNAYESELRDKTHGRIYRIVWTGENPNRPSGKKPAAKKQKPFTLQGASPSKLVATLRHDNLLWRRHAQRLLVERGRQDVAPELIALTRDRSVDAIGLNVGVIHAIWTLEGLNALDTDPAAQAAVVETLRHPSAGVRRAAADALPRSAANAVAIVNSGLLNDSDPHVRLAALLAIAESPRLPAEDAKDDPEEYKKVHTAWAPEAKPEWRAASKTLHAALKDPNWPQDKWVAAAVRMAAVKQGLQPAATPAETPKADDKTPVYTIELSVTPGEMKFDKAELNALAGQEVKLVFRNTDHMPHNVLVLRPGTTEKVGALADKMLAETNAAERHYVPESENVIAHTPLVNPGETYELRFKTPPFPAPLPIICTFPGHWRLMQSVLLVKP